jgi:two-component system nitrate/nitrite sensor histidine kinase NarX
LAGESNQREGIEIEIDGQRIPLEIIAKPISSPDGSVQYVISAFRDISERKKQEMAVRLAQELYESLVEKEVLLICRFSPQGFLTFVNRAYCDYFGSSRDELLGTNYIDSINTSGRDVVKNGLAKITPDNPLLPTEYQVVSSNGQIRWLRWTNQGFFDDQQLLIEYQATGEDITEQKYIEEQLAHYRENLEDLVAERTRQERHQRAIAESLQLSASVLTSDLRLDSVLVKILEQLPQVVALGNAAIYLKDGENLVLSNATVDDPTEQTITFPLSQTRAPVVKVFAEKRSLFISDLKTDPYWSGWDPPFHSCSWMGTPLQAGDEVIGVLSVSSDIPDRYSKDDLPILDAFANHATIAIVNARLYEGSRRAAILEERNRLARDLHDSVTQTLFSASIVAQALPLQWEQDRDGARENLHRLHQLTSGALAEMRMLLVELRPGSLEKYPISTLMMNLCEAFQVKYNISTHLKLVGEDDPESPMEVREYFYRITQEALNNIAKHSKASHVKVFLEQTKEVLALQIQDDGRGFDTHDLEPGHFGLQIMRERAEAIHATMNINSRPGVGTVISSEWKRSP